MPATSLTSVHQQDPVEAPPDDFWAQCRRKALELNIPAWKLAEEFYRHDALDERSRTK